jgi:ATP-dependent Clp protease ATP-binding subunit ClpB
MLRKVISVVPKSAKLSRISFRLRHGPVVLALAERIQPHGSSRQPSVIPGYYHVRSYASQPPGSAGGGGVGGFPGFMQQHQKGDALKEYVILSLYSVLSLTIASECRLDGNGQEWEVRPYHWP